MASETKNTGFLNLPAFDAKVRKEGGMVQIFDALRGRWVKLTPEGQHCDTPYPQTLAEEYGVYGIGYNSDMSKETPDATLCSVIWNWSAYYTSAVKSIMDGTWTGENYYGGMQEGLVAITGLASFVAEGTQEKVDEATASILSGECNVFDGAMETNTGEIIGTEGGTLDDATITGGINWYYKNVVIVE